MQKKILPVFFLLFIAFFQGSIFAQSFTLVKDINYGNPGRCEGWQGQPLQNLMNANGTLFFTTGSGLWKSDGTATGTILVKGGILIESIININGTLFFIGNDQSTHVQTLWKSDGTEAGTIMLKDLSVCLVSYLTNADGVLYFKVFYSSSSYQLWKTDGTEAGTQLVKIFTNLEGLTFANGTLFFKAADGAFSTTLWKTDGTEAGTVTVKNNLAISNTFPANGTLYFTASDGISGAELWKSDGTEHGTIMVKDIGAGSGGSNPRNFAALDGLVYFFAENISNGVALWRTDGTETGTLMVKDIDDGVNMVNVNGTLFFSGYANATGYELWKSDGTEAGTMLVKDIFPGNGWSSPHNLIDVNGVLFFSAADEELPPGVQINCSYPGELWKSDGTEAGTVMVKNIYKGVGTSNPSKLVNVSGILFFTANNGLQGTELWKTDGTEAGTVMLNDMFTTAGSNPRYFTLMNGLVYFNAFDAHSGPGVQIKATELHRTDGTVSETYQVADIFGLGHSHPNQLTNMDGTLFFSANNGSHGYELFKSNGIYTPVISLETTGMVKDINPYFGSIPDRGSNPSGLTPMNGTLYFSASNFDNGYELWKTDGTTAGTVMVKDINPGAGNSNPSDLVVINGTIYFSADDGVNGKELWKTDGSEGGTVLVKNINGGSNSSDPTSLTSINDVLYFAATNGGDGMELWKSDGTGAGTVMIKDINPGTNNSNPTLLKNINNLLYFAANNGTEGNELWKSDGTESGTVLVKDVNPGITDSNPLSLINLNGIVYFSADDGSNGRELWKSNGTVAGTVLIKDINPVGDSNPTVLFKIGTAIMFAANDGAAGNEIWVSNGTEVGTRMMQDIEPGPNSSDPSEIIEYNTKVLIAAFNSSTGREIWVANAPAESPLPLELLEFKGAIVNNTGWLQWKTDNESNTAAFIIERSNDGRNYKSIGSVTAANSAGIHYYDYTDPDILSLSAPVIYYRLKQTDLDGQYTYSNIVSLVVDNNRTIVMLYPNPVRNSINLTITVPSKEKLQWQLLDNTGRAIRKGQYDLSAGGTALSIDASQLSSGVYLMQLNGASIQQVIKVVKQ